MYLSKDLEELVEVKEFHKLLRKQKKVTSLFSCAAARR